MSRRPATVRPRSGTPRLVAAAMAALLLAVQLGTYAHLVNVRHEVCGQHGELVDVDRGPSGQRGAPVEATAVGARLLASTAALGRHDHDHCALAPHRRESDTLSPDRQAASPAPPLASVSAPADDGADLAHSAVCSFAPKTSPPT